MEIRITGKGFEAIQKVFGGVIGIIENRGYTISCTVQGDKENQILLGVNHPENTGRFKDSRWVLAIFLPELDTIEVIIGIVKISLEFSRQQNPAFQDEIDELTELWKEACIKAGFQEVTEKSGLKKYVLHVS